MKAKILGTSLIAATAAVVLCYPMFRSEATVVPADPVPVVSASKKVEVVFVLDTTSSMSGLIDAAKSKIWSIASTLAQAQQSPEVHMGLVAFRDRSDDYVTQVVDLSTDVDSMYSTLMQFTAAGGGDGPESVNAALHDAVHNVSWGQDPDVYRVIFLVGDAPPHMDYAGEVQYPQIVADARAKGIVVNTIQCGEQPNTRQHWSRIASLGNGRYMQVGQSGDALAISTPYDDQLAELSAALDGTRLFYGDAEAQQRLQAKADVAEEAVSAAPAATRARRAVFNSTASGAINLFGDSDLIADVAAGNVDLAEVDEAQLPQSIAALAPEEREAAVADVARQREALREEIEALSVQRSEYIESEVAGMGGAAESLDAQFYDAIREQGARAKLEYTEGPQY